MLVQVREGQSTSLHPLNNRVSNAQWSESHFEFPCFFFSFLNSIDFIRHKPNLNFKSPATFQVNKKVNKKVNINDQ